MIDWTLLLLVVIGILFVLGLVLALQTAAGRKRLGEAALALAERLLAYAVRWLERSLPEQSVAGSTETSASSVEPLAEVGTAGMANDLDRASAALRAIRGST